MIHVHPSMKMTFVQLILQDPFFLRQMLSFWHCEVVDLQSGLQQQEEADDLQRRQPLDGKSDREEQIGF